MGAERYLTKEAFDKLKKELSFLETTKRREIAEQLKQAKSYGDLSENAAYDDAREAQSLLEGRIAEIRDKLANSKVVEKSSNGLAGLGSNIKVKSDGEEREFSIVSPEEVDIAKGKISNESPLGKAFLGKKKGDFCEVETPSGKIKFKIISVN